MAVILTDSILQHIHTLLYEIEPPDLPQELASIPMLVNLHATLLDIREVTLGLAKGDISRKITSQGVISGHLKKLRANLKRLTSMKAFSEEFNHMMVQLESTVRMLEQNESRFRHMAHMAYHDALTGVLGRAIFMTDGELLLREAVTASEPFGLIFADIDRFKNFNDTHGHQAGDAVLRHVAALFGKVLRGNDHVYRYGGEEFVTIFKGVSLDNAQRIAERMRCAVEKSPVSWEGLYLPVTASFGVCVTDPEAGNNYSFGYIIKTADENMYAAKAAGRNRIVSTLCSYPVHRRRKMDN